MHLDPVWQQLDDCRASLTLRTIRSLFDDPARAERFSLDLDGLLFDYSKTLIDSRARGLLLDLARRAGVEDRRDAMFAGARINVTENRAVLHVALRDLDRSFAIDGQPVSPGILDTLARMEDLARDIREGRFACQGGPCTDVINIGIGGSDLGPVMATMALSPWHDGPRIHFVSNLDGAQVSETLRGLDPSRTLVIIASKTFTTVETMTNAMTVRDWLVAGGVEAASHLIAVSSDGAKAAIWGIPAARVFGFCDCIGGRYSVWGPVGLGLMIAIGPERFREFLAGAAAMDSHFLSAPLEANMPVLLALVGIWHNQICGHATRAVIPYDQRLARLPAYLQQLEMESNGKQVDMEGCPLPRDSGPVVWGEPGTNGQHAFFQLIHQGTRTVPVEFLIAARGHEPHLAHHHRMLIANCLAQSEALMQGRSLEVAREMMRAAGLDGDELERQARHRVFTGNRPSTTLVYDQLTPFELGRILALYEHRVFVEGVILGINSFDQWGVELGKELARTLEPLLEPGADDSARDGSTRLLLARLRARTD